MVYIYMYNINKVCVGPFCDIVIGEISPNGTGLAPQPVLLSVERQDFPVRKAWSGSNDFTIRSLERNGTVVVTKEMG